MKKLHFLGVVVLLFFSCNRMQKGEKIVEVASPEISSLEWVKKSTVNSKAAAILTTWPEYNAFDSSLDALYDGKNMQDIAIGIEDLINQQKLLLKSEYPEDFNVPQIKSRQKVLGTYLLKTKAHLEYGLPIQEVLDELLVANNAMRNQFNVTVNNPLNNSLTLEETN